MIRVYFESIPDGYSDEYISITIHCKKKHRAIAEEMKTFIESGLIEKYMEIDKNK